MRNPLGCVYWMAAIAFVVVAGCASTPKFRYYTIDMQPKAQIAPEVQIGAVRIDVVEALKRPAILIRTAPTQVDYYALDRWASGLDEQIGEKLMTEFAAAPPTAPKLNIDGTLMAFDQIDTANGAKVHVKLEIRNNGLKFQKIYSRTEPAEGANARAVVDALSRATEAIAKDLAADLAAVVAEQPKQ